MPDIIAKLRKPFASRVNEWLRRCKGAGYMVLVTCGTRSLEEQEAIYAQGRKPVDVVNSIRRKAGLREITARENVIVSKAKPGFSWHNYGLAVDVVPIREDGKPDWIYNPRDPSDIYDEIANLAKGVDSQIKWGGDFVSFKDYCHFEWHPGVSISYVIKLDDLSVLDDENFWSRMKDN